MPHERSISISSFKFGLDTRREELVASPGTLTTCQNAHISNGGEIVKRGAFILDGTLSPLDSNGAQGTFGLEVTDAGPMTFGSALAFGATVSQSQPTLVAAPVAPAVYQQLKHPELVRDTTYNYSATVHRMTSVVHSENFNGKALVIAQFADASGAANRFLYYNGSIVYQSQNGLALFSGDGSYPFTESRQATELYRQFKAIGWNAKYPSADGDASHTDVQSPAGDYYTAICTKTNTDLGTFGAKVNTFDSASTTGTRAKASVKVSGGSGTFQFEAPSSADGTGIIDLCGTPITPLGTDTLTAAAIVAAINALTQVHGYSAINNTNDVFVFAPLSFGNVTFNLTVLTTGLATTAAATLTPTLPINVTITTSPSAITGPFSHAILQVTKSVPKKTTAIATLQGTATAQAVSQTGIATYVWTQISGGTAITTSDTNKASIVFTAIMAVNTTAIATFSCKATDNVGNTGTSIITVAFFYSVIR